MWVVPGAVHMLISFTKAGLQSPFRALFLPSEPSGTDWPLPRNPALPTDDRAKSSGLLFTNPDRGFG